MYNTSRAKLVTVQVLCWVDDENEMERSFEMNIVFGANLRPDYPCLCNVKQGIYEPEYTRAMRYVAKKVLLNKTIITGIEHEVYCYVPSI